MAGRCAGTKERRRRGVFQNTILYPIPGPMVEQGTWAAMADPGTPAAMAGQGNPAAMAGQGSPGHGGSRESGQVGHGRLWPWLYSPPKKRNIGEVTVRGTFANLMLYGALWQCRLLEALGGADFVGSRTEGDSVGSRTGVDSVGSWTGTDGGGLVLDRAWTLSRHQRIPTLQLSPVVSERSTGQW